MLNRQGTHRRSVLDGLPAIRKLPQKMRFCPDRRQHGLFRNSTLTWVLFSCVRHDKSAFIPDDSFSGRGILSRGCRSCFYRPLCGCLVRCSGGLAHSLDGHGALCWCFFNLGLAFLPLLRYSGQDVSQFRRLKHILVYLVFRGRKLSIQLAVSKGVPGSLILSNVEFGVLAWSIPRSSF